MRPARWLQVHRPLSPRARLIVGIVSFLLPIGLWCLVSYDPAVWHSQVRITDPGSVDYLEVGAHMDKAAFASEVQDARTEHRAEPKGVPANPIYLPAPHEVLKAFYTSFTTPPESQDGQWLHQSLWHSIQIMSRT